MGIALTIPLGMGAGISGEALVTGLLVGTAAALTGKLADCESFSYEPHTSNSRPSTKRKHEKGDARRARDQKRKEMRDEAMGKKKRPQDKK